MKVLFVAVTMMSLCCLDSFANSQDMQLSGKSICAEKAVSAVLKTKDMNKAKKLKSFSGSSSKAASLFGKAIDEKLSKGAKWVNALKDNSLDEVAKQEAKKKLVALMEQNAPSDYLKMCDDVAKLYVECTNKKSEVDVKKCANSQKTKMGEKLGKYLLAKIDKNKSPSKKAKSPLGKKLPGGFGR